MSRLVNKLFISTGPQFSPSIGTWQGGGCSRKKEKMDDIAGKKICNKHHTKLPGREVYYLWSWKLL